MLRKLLALSAVCLSLCATSTAQARSEVHIAKAHWYKANGVVRWIGSHARVTQYHPNPRKKHYWQSAARYWTHVRDEAWHALHPSPQLDRSLVAAFTCIHHYEGGWTANTGNGYYGGLQMDMGFQSSYGSEYLHRYGTADQWPIRVQLLVAIRAYRSGRGFYPWPNTARACGLI